MAHSGAFDCELLRDAGCASTKDVDPYEICRYDSITMEIFEDVYAHHHPDFMTGVHKGFSRHRNRHQNAATDREQTSANVVIIAEKSGAGR